MLPKLLSQLLCLCLISSALGLSCISCNSTSNEECLSNTVTKKINCSADINNCLTQVDNTGIVKRGCSESGTSCTAPNCLECKEDNCNNHIICQSCTSSSDATCVQGVVSSVLNTVCPIADTQCYVGLKEKVTVRRCADENDKATCTAANADCTLCSGANCNVGIFPTNRLQCYQCQNSTECLNPATTAGLQPLACPNYETNDKCYSTGTSASNIQRGCVSDFANNACPDNSCTTCSGNGCNTAVPGILTCIECRSDNDANCVNNVSGYGSVTCPTSTTTETPKCYQSWYNNLFIRGCLANAVPRLKLICNNANGPCTTCNTSNCNFSKANGAAINTLTSGFLLLAAMLTLRQYA